MVPQVVLDVIDRLANGDTATKDEIEEVLKFGDYDE